MKRNSVLALVLICALLLSACSVQQFSDILLPSPTVTTADTKPTTQVNPDEVFSNRDFKTDYDESESAVITLTGDSASCASDAVKISGRTRSFWRCRPRLPHFPAR